MNRNRTQSATSNLFWRAQVNLQNSVEASCESINSLESSSHRHLRQRRWLKNWKHHTHLSKWGEKVVWLSWGHLVCNSIQVCRQVLQETMKISSKMENHHFYSCLVIVWLCRTNIIAFFKMTVLSRQKKYSVLAFSKTAGLVPCEKVSA